MSNATTACDGPGGTSHPTDRELLAMARDVAHRAYVPYSHFHVGAAVVSTDGRVISGCNVENAAYGEAICAERNAVTTLIARRDTKEPMPKIATVAVIGLEAAPCWPCGACRQVLREFHCQRVVVENESGEPIALPFDEILPLSFGPEALEGVK